MGARGKIVVRMAMSRRAGINGSGGGSCGKLLGVRRESSACVLSSLRGSSFLSVLLRELCTTTPVGSWAACVCCGASLLRAGSAWLLSRVCRHMQCYPESSKEKRSQSCRHSPVCVDTSLAFQKNVRRMKPVVSTQIQCVLTQVICQAPKQNPVSTQNLIVLTHNDDDSVCEFFWSRGCLVIKGIDLDIYAHALQGSTWTHGTIYTHDPRTPKVMELGLFQKKRRRAGKSSCIQKGSKGAPPRGRRRRKEEE
ncbi:hypothetical protein Taro_034892, partial [Colocasia esculenta]|nr:hypothetical protein [Colocasia esculenta]